MSELGDDFREWRKAKQAKKESNREYSTRLLTAAGWPFESKNAGVHLVVKHPHCVIDYWPSTGKWMVRQSHINGRGIMPLLKFLQVQPIPKE